MEKTNSLKIFVVDDDKFCLNIYKQHFLNIGYTNVETFSNGTDCLNRLTENPDIIFLDHSMKILNGLEVLKKIKRFNPNINVVFISSQNDIQTAVNSLKYGAFDYIVKGDDEQRRIDSIIKKIIQVKALLEKKNKGVFKKIFSFSNITQI